MLHHNFSKKISINLLLTMLLLQHHDCCPQHSMIHCLCLSFDVIANLIAPVFLIVCHCGLWWKGHPKCPKEHCVMSGIPRSHQNDQHFPSNESMFGQNLTLAAVSMSFLWSQDNWYFQQVNWNGVSWQFVWNTETVHALISLVHTNSHTVNSHTVKALLKQSKLQLTLVDPVTSCMWTKIDKGNRKKGAKGVDCEHSAIECAMQWF